MPNYTGTITLLVGVVIVLLKAFGWQMPAEFKGQAVDAITAVVTAGTMLVGVWRLLHTKGVVDQLSDQVLLRGGVPVAGPQKGQLPPPAGGPQKSGGFVAPGMQRVDPGFLGDDLHSNPGALDPNRGSIGAGLTGSKVFSATHRQLAFIAIVALTSLALTACTAQQLAAALGGTPSQGAKTTIAEVYGDACRAYDTALKFGDEAVNADLLTRPQVDAIGAAQRIGTPLCTGPLPANVAAALVQIGTVTLQITTAATAAK